MRKLIFLLILLMIAMPCHAIKVSNEIADSPILGLTWNESTDAYTRTDSLSGLTLAASPGNSYLPIHAQMRRCILSDAGVVQYYLCSTDSTLKADCSTPANIDGTDGQVMVEIPAFYYYYNYSGTTHTWKISQYPKTGYDTHPAFTKDGSFVAKRYIGAYEGVLYDVSGSAYTQGTSSQVKDWTNDKLSSVSGFKAVTNGTRAQFRKIASNRGAGWRQLDYDLHSAVQLLYLVEYASFYSQNMIGAGISNVTDWAAYNNYYPIAASGNSNAIGNGTGNTAGATLCATEVSEYMSYRGIENWYGHLWKFVDGININSGRPYATNVQTNFADDTTTNYTDLGANMGTTSGDQHTLIQVGRGFLPASVGASSSTKITDYYWYASGWRVLVVGGGAYNGVLVGGFCVSAASASTGFGTNIGGRVCF